MPNITIPKKMVISFLLERAGEISRKAKELILKANVAPREAFNRNAIDVIRTAIAIMRLAYLYVNNLNKNARRAHIMPMPKIQPNTLGSIHPILVISSVLKRSVKRRPKSINSEETIVTKTI